MAENIQAKFWMVYGMGQGAPTHRHYTKVDAQNEAGRLALRNPGVTFVVLAAVDACCAKIPTIDKVKIVRRELGDDIPF